MLINTAHEGMRSCQTQPRGIRSCTSLPFRFCTGVAPPEGFTRIIVEVNLDWACWVPVLDANETAAVCKETEAWEAVHIARRLIDKKLYAAVAVAHYTRTVAPMSAHPSAAVVMTD